MDVEFLRYQFSDGFDGVVVKNKFKIGVRHVQMVYMIVCSAVLGAMRGSTGIAMLALTDITRLNDTYIQIHNWDRKIQGTILSSFFFGYALMLVPAQMFIKKTGGKYALTAVLVVNGALSVAMPTIVNKGGWIAVSNAQLWMGMSQACLSPANQKLLLKWLPPYERGIFSGLVYAGVLFGIVISMPIAGLLSESRLGWELIFYTQAMLTLAMAIIWGLLTASSPAKHEAVGDREKEYIRDSLEFYRKKVLHVPWRCIFRSQHFWAVTCAHAASSALFVFYLTDVPAYLLACKVSLRDSSWQSLLPFAALWLIYITTAPTIEWICRTMQTSFHLNIAYLRKFINTLGAVGIVIGLTVLPNLSECQKLNVAAFTCILGMLGFQFSGFLENHKDLSQNYCETLLMLSSAVASVFGALVPLVSGTILSDDWADLKRWRTVFLSMACFYAFCNILYMALASGDRQYWDGAAVATKKFGYHNCMIDTQLELEEIGSSKLTQQKIYNDTTI